MRTGQGVMQRLGRMGMLGIALIGSGCGGDGGSGAVPPTAGPAPAAEAGRDQTVLAGTPVRLDGSRSVSRTTGLITYHWTLTDRPAGSAATLSGATTVRPTFTADVPGAYTAQLVVDNGGLSSSPDTVTITCGTGNLPPVADAGPDRTVRPGTLVTLHGTDSYDPNGTPVAYAWTVLSQPPSSQAVLVNPSSATPTFTPMEVGQYRIALTVSDGHLTSPPDQIEITVAVGDVAPVAVAGPDQQVSTGQVIMLTGAGSTDPNGDPLTYSWRFQCLPAGSTATLADAATGHPSFTADVAGQYVVSLVVNNGALSSAVDTVVIEVRLDEVRGFNGPVRQVIGAADGSGDIYVAGPFTSYRSRAVAQVVRLKPDGALHEPFKLAESIGPVASIAVADDGSGDLYVADQLPGLPMSTGRIWKVNPDGTLDSSFAVGTAVFDSSRTLDDLPFGSVVRSLVSVGDHSGRFYAALSGRRYNDTAVGRVVRLNADGSLDRTFVAGAIPSVFRIVPAQDGTERIYVATYVQDDPGSIVTFRLLRLNPDGTVDSTFSTGNEGPFSRINLVVPVQDGTGDLLATGVFDAILRSGGLPVELHFVRFNPDGSLDLAAPKPQVERAAYVVALAKATDGTGDWLVEQLIGDERLKVQRYKANGTLDPSFTTGDMIGNARHVLHVIVPAPDHSGDFYVAGEFSSYNGVAANHLVRINGNGTLDERSR